MSCSTKVSMKFQLLIQTKIICFQPLRDCIYLINVKMPTKYSLHFNINIHDKFHPQFS